MEKTKLNIKGLKFGLDPHDSNTIPPEPNTEPEVVPNPKEVKDCMGEWKKYFSNKDSTKAKLGCCLSKKYCECVVSLCTKDPNEKGCSVGVDGQPIECKPAGCESFPDLKLEQCMNFKTLPKTITHTQFAWWWILIILAVIVIIIICITIYFVYQKKFGKRDSSKDKKHGKITFGTMNVKSKVQWHGKKKGSKRSIRSSKNSQQSLARRTSGSSVPNTTSGTKFNTSSRPKSTRISKSAMVKAIQ